MYKLAFVFICSAFLGCYIPQNNKYMIEDATETEPLVIEMYSSGCFSQIHEVLKIYKDGNQYRYEKLHIFSDSTITSGTCKPGFERAYRKFESTARDLKAGDGCTTIQSFDISSPKRKFAFEDKACEFEEYHHLCEMLN